MVTRHRSWLPAFQTAAGAAGIQTSAQARRVALLDYDDKGVRSSLRISPHYSNTEGEIDRAVETIASWATH